MIYYKTEKMYYTSNGDWDAQLAKLERNGWTPIWIKELVWKEGSGGIAVVKFRIKD